MSLNLEESKYEDNYPTENIEVKNSGKMFSPRTLTTLEPVIEENYSL